MELAICRACDFFLASRGTSSTGPPAWFCAIVRLPSVLDDPLLDQGNDLARTEVVWTDLNTIHDGATKAKPEWIEGIKAGVGRLVPAIHDSAIGLQQNGRALADDLQYRRGMRHTAP